MTRKKNQNSYHREKRIIYLNPKLLLGSAHLPYWVAVLELLNSDPSGRTAEVQILYLQYECGVDLVAFLFPPSPPPPFRL